MKKLVIVSFLSILMLQVANSYGQQIDCKPCQNINGNFNYSIDYRDPFWVAFKKKVNCIPTTQYGLSNLQTAEFSVYDVSVSGNGPFTIEPSFDNLWTNIVNSTTPISATTIANFAGKFRGAIEYKLNGNTYPPSGSITAWRVKCIEIVYMNYVGQCCGPQNWDIKVKVLYGQKAIIPPID